MRLGSQKGGQEGILTAWMDAWVEVPVMPIMSTKSFLMPPFQPRASKHATFPLRWADRDPRTVDRARSAWVGKGSGERRGSLEMEQSGDPLPGMKGWRGPRNVGGMVLVWRARAGTLFPHPLPHPQTKVVLLFSTPEPQQLAEELAGPIAWPRRLVENSVSTLLDSLAAPPRMRGAGDGAEWHAGTRAGPREAVPGPRRAAEGGGAPWAPGDQQRFRPRPGAPVQAGPLPSPARTLAPTQ